jgi:hypothetical protein
MAAMDRATIKAELAEVAQATEAGFAAGGEQIERIKALAAALESANPTPDSARADALLFGRWELLYSSFGLERETTLSRLSFNALPKTPVRVGSIWQEVDPASGLYDNIVDHDDGSLVTLGQFKPSPENPVRLDIVFTDLLELGTGSARVPINNAKIPPLWSDVTYLDEDFRLNRGGFGNLYVLRKVDPTPARWSRHA